MSFRDERGPFDDLAFPEFKRQFGDLFSVRAQVQDFELGLIVGVMGNLIFLRGDDRDKAHFEATVRAAHTFLDGGALQDPRGVCQSFMSIANQISLAMDQVLDVKREAREAEGDDARIRAHLSLYKSMYEGLMPVIAAPVVVGFSRHYGSKAKEFVPKPDGRINLRAIEKMEDWIIFPQNRLREGLNNHVRNAYSHERFRILDGARVEMWDEDHRGRPTWGPEIWSLEQLEAICERLFVTALGIMGALALFSINYRKLIADRGWGVDGMPSPALRLRQSRQMAEAFADSNSFTLTNFARADGTLRISLKTRHRGVDQNEEIYLGGDGWARGYIKPVRYQQALVAEMVLGVVQRASVNVDEVERFHVSVKDEKDQDVGEFVITRAALARVGGPAKGRIADDRQLADVDTLSNAQMWQKIAGGLQPRRPKKRRAQ